MRFLAKREPWGNRVSFAIFERKNDRLYVADPIVVRERDANEIIQPCFSIDSMDEPSLRGLMDELWSCGIRPTDYTSNDKASAMSRHLEDMRAITFSRLQIERPK